MVKREIVKEIKDRCVETMSMVNALEELEAEVGGFLAMVKGVREKAGEGIRPDMSKSIFHQFSVGFQNL